MQSPNQQAPSSQRKHFDELDSIRGLAALGVVIHHWHLVWRALPHSSIVELVLQILPFRLFFSGRADVIMFFVLSGFVLSLPQVRGRPVQYPGYLIKRICRIYLPYLVALGLAVLGCWQFHGLKAYGPWFSDTWSQGPTWTSVRHHLLFLGNYPEFEFNTAFWTLVQEMRLSLVFPLLCGAVLFFRWKGGLCVAVGSVSLAVILGEFTDVPQTYLATTGYAGIFVLGILLARYTPQGQALLQRLDRRTYWSIFALCMLTYAYSSTLFLTTSTGLVPTQIWVCVSDTFTAVGAAGIVLFALVDRRVSGLLLHRSLRFLGRISYSMYLLHGTVLFTFAYLLYRHMSPSAWLLPYVLTTVVLATLMYRAVEAPSMRLGRFLAAKAGTTSKWLIVSPSRVDHRASLVPGLVESHKEV